MPMAWVVDALWTMQDTPFENMLQARSDVRRDLGPSGFRFRIRVV